MLRQVAAAVPPLHAGLLVTEAVRRLAAAPLAAAARGGAAVARVREVSLQLGNVRTLRGWILATGARGSCGGFLVH